MSGWDLWGVSLCTWLRDADGSARASSSHTKGTLCVWLCSARHNMRKTFLITQFVVIRQTALFFIHRLHNIKHKTNQLVLLRCDPTTDVMWVDIMLCVGQVNSCCLSAPSVLTARRKSLHRSVPQCRYVHYLKHFSCFTSSSSCREHLLSVDLVPSFLQHSVLLFLWRKWTHYRRSSACDRIWVSWRENSMHPAVLIIVHLSDRKLVVYPCRKLSCGVTIKK